MQNNKNLTDSWKLSLIVILILISSTNGSEMWKISFHNGSSLSSTELYKLTNDSLYTKILGNKRNFALDDISNITSFKKNINIGLISGSVAGGLLGYLGSNKKNSETAPMIGAISGALLAHIINSNKSVRLSNMSIKDKHDVIENLVFK